MEALGYRDTPHMVELNNEDKLVDIDTDILSVLRHLIGNSVVEVTCFSAFKETMD